MPLQTPNLAERNAREAAPPCPATAAARTCLPLLRPAEPLLPHLPPPVALLQTPSPLPQTTSRLSLLLLLRPAMVLLPLPTIFEFPLSLYLLPLLSPLSFCLSLPSFPHPQAGRACGAPCLFLFFFSELRMRACGAFPLSPLPFSPVLSFIYNKQWCVPARCARNPTQERV